MLFQQYLHSALMDFLQTFVASAFGTKMNWLGLGQKVKGQGPGMTKAKQVEVYRAAHCAWSCNRLVFNQPNFPELLKLGISQWQKLWGLMQQFLAGQLPFLCHQQCQSSEFENAL